MLFALAIALSAPAAPTTMGPELVARFSVDEARGPFALGVGEVLVVRQPRTLERRTLAGKINERVELPCDAIDVAAGERAWAVLCADRIVMERARLSNEVTRHTVVLAPQATPPALLAVEPFHGSWIVAYEDGLVQRGRFLGEGEAQAGSVEEIDLRARPVSLVLTGIHDGTIALADGTQHAWRGARVDAAAASPATLVELYEDAAGERRARVSRNATSGSSTTVPTKRGLMAASVSSSGSSSELSSHAIDALDVSAAVDALCARSGATLTCYGTPPPPPPEIAPRQVPRSDEVELPSVADGAAGGDEESEFQPPLDFGTAGAIAALVSTALGAGSFASAPFAMQALSPSLGIAPAFALAGLGAVAGVASFGAAAGAVLVIAAVVAMTVDDDKANDGIGACRPGFGVFDVTFDDCCFAVAAAVALAAAAAAAASVGVAVLATASMPPVDVALGGRAPANEPFFVTLGGAAAGSAAGFAVGTGISYVTSPLRGEDDDDEPDDELAKGLDGMQRLSWIIGGGAVGAAIGYGVARGP